MFAVATLIVLVLACVAHLLVGFTSGNTTPMRLGLLATPPRSQAPR